MAFVLAARALADRLPRAPLGDPDHAVGRLRRLAAMHHRHKGERALLEATGRLEKRRLAVNQGVFHAAQISGESELGDDCPRVQDQMTCCNETLHTTAPQDYRASEMPNFLRP